MTIDRTTHQCKELIECNNKLCDDYLIIKYRCDSWRMETKSTYLAPIKACPFCGIPLLPIISDPKPSTNYGQGVCMSDQCWNYAIQDSKYCEEHKFKDYSIPIHDTTQGKWFNVDIGAADDFKDKIEKRLDKLENDLLEIRGRQEVKNPILYYKLNERLDKLEEDSKFYKQRLDRHRDEISKLEEDVASNRDD